MTLMNVLSTLMSERKEIDLKKLPSQGYFYPKDMKLKIKKAETDDIQEYERDINRLDMIKSIECIKRVVQKNVCLNKKYSYIDLKSVDIIFIFLEIVMFTTSKELLISYIDKAGQQRNVSFSQDNFNYFDFIPFLQFYDEETREIVIADWRYSFPCIGVENSLTDYLSSITEIKKIDELRNISYNFLFFLTGKNFLSFDEIENIIQIFNFELDDKAKQTVDDIVSRFSAIISYSLKVEGMKVEMKSSLNLELIWQ